MSTLTGEGNIDKVVVLMDEASILEVVSWRMIGFQIHRRSRWIECVQDHAVMSYEGFILVGYRLTRLTISII